MTVIPWCALLLPLLVQFTCGDVVQVHSESNCVNATKFNAASNSGHCVSLNMALSNLTDDSNISLSHGHHTLSFFSPDSTSDLSNVRLVGDPSRPEMVVVDCADGVGLFFFNISSLFISGITIENCGLSGEDNIYLALERPYEVIDFHYKVLKDFSAALLLIHTQDLQISDVIIRNTSGFGLVGINMVGSVHFYQVQILGNYPSQCVIDKNNFTIYGGSGGGAFILYQDYLKTMLDHDNHHDLVLDYLKTDFNMTSSLVGDNYACRLDPFNILHEKLSRSIQDPISSNLSLIGAGGLSFVMVQSSYEVNGNFDDCTFHNNSGTYNGEAMQIIIHEAVNNSHVSISNGNFHHNGEYLYEKHGTLGLGPAGAILVRYYVPSQEDHHDDNSAELTALLASQLPSGVTISDSSFKNNTAKYGGAVCVIAFRPTARVVQDTLEIRDSSFVHNQADFGGALYLNGLSYNAFVPGLQVSFNSIKAFKNLRLDLSASNSLQARSGIIDINFLTVALSGYNYISSNLDTGITLNGAILEVSGSALLARNTGSTGGALSVNAESYVVAKEAVNYTFLENSATVAGGGIYVNLAATRLSTYDCFFFFHKIDFFCNFLGNCPSPFYTHFQFINNTAPFGSAIYGTTFRDCPWAEPNLNSFGDDVESTIYFLNSLGVSFDPPLELNSTNIVNTIASKIVSQSEREVEVIPGEQFEALLGAFDRLNQSVPVTVFSSIIPNNKRKKINASSSIGQTNLYLLDNSSEFTTVPIKVFGRENNSYNIGIISDEAPVEYSISVKLKPCPLGYKYDESIQSCKCEIDEYYSDISCTGLGGTISIGRPWVGYIGDQYARGACILDYCNSSISEVSLDYANAQCQNRRSGILCGKCESGYSRVLGSSYGCKVCSNDYISLILFFAVMGLILVVLITVFNVTITGGYINGIIFYSNIMTIYLNAPSQSFEAALFRVPIYLLNLQVGFETCFYNGMNDIHAAFLNFIFPVYLIVILILITLLVKWVDNKHLVKFISRINITHVFATLILLSYTSLIRSCIDVLDFTEINIENTIYRRWWIDANQGYFQGAHIPLFFISILFLLIFLPISVILLIPQFFLRYSTLKPLLDAFIAPLKQDSLSWVGFRILCRMAFLLFTLLDVEYRYPLLCISITFITILEAYIKPFESTIQNLIDLSIMVNLTIISVLGLTSTFVPEKDKGLNSAISALLDIFLIQALCIFFFHILASIPLVRKFTKRVVSNIKKTFASFMEYLQKTEPKVRNRVLSKHGTTRRVTTDEITHSSLEYPVEGEQGDFQPAAFVGYRESIFESSQVIPNQNERRSRNTAIEGKMS